ncbi:MAG: hypothetical protein QTN59_11570 [Candidatus Electrothrix communis]|nr:MAG: hypothetical protein QTN59_11570 [Candidatus Electrothrix communis]
MYKIIILLCLTLFSSPASAGRGRLTLVGLLYGELDFDVNTDRTLHISAPHVKKAQVHIRGIGIPFRTYYLLDAWLQPGDFFVWPLDYVKKNKLSSNKIGVVAQLVTEPDVYTPLVVGNNTASSAPLNLVLRSLDDVQTLLWQRSKMINRQCEQSKGNWHEITPDWGDRFFSGLPILLSLSDQKDNFCIEFAAQATRTAGWLKLSLKILLNE